MRATAPFILMNSVCLPWALSLVLIIIAPSLLRISGLISGLLSLAFSLVMITIAPSLLRKCVLLPSAFSSILRITAPSLLRISACDCCQCCHCYWAWRCHAYSGFICLCNANVQNSGFCFSRCIRRVATEIIISVRKTDVCRIKVSQKCSIYSGITGAGIPAMQTQLDYQLWLGSSRYKTYIHHGPILGSLNRSHRSVTSDVFLAEISLRSPRKLFIYII